MEEIGKDILNWVTLDDLNIEGAFPHYGNWEMPSRGRFTVDGYVSGRCEWWRTEWARPDSQGRPIDWVTSVRLATLGDDVECGLRIRIKARERFITGDFASVDPPRIIPLLIEKPGFSATCMGETVSASPTHLTGPRIGRFISDRLENDHRRLPIVMVSTDNMNGQSLVDVHRLSGQLSGLAEVSFLRDKDSAWELTNQVGKKYSCFNGAIRVYWPGFRIKIDDPFSHRLWLRDYIEDRGQSAFEKILFNFLCSRVGRALGDSPVWREVHREIQVQREDEWRQKLEELGADKYLTEIVLDSIQNDLREVEKDRDDFIEYATELERQLKESEKERNNLTRENDQLRVALGAQQALPKDIDHGSLSIETVLDAVQAARDLPNTEVLDTAIDSARRSQSNRGSDLYKVFLVLDRLAADYRRGLGKGVRDWLHEQLPDVSHDYASDLSDTTASKREQTYTFGGIYMPKHLKFGGGHNTRNLLRVHFEYEFDDGPPRCVIGHVGEHLPNEMS